MLLYGIVSEKLDVSQEEEYSGNVKQQLAKLFDASLKAAFPTGPDVEPLVAACTSKFGDYQWYDVILFWK